MIFVIEFSCRNAAFPVEVLEWICVFNFKAEMVEIDDLLSVENIRFAGAQISSIFLLIMSVAGWLFVRQSDMRDRERKKGEKF